MNKKLLTLAKKLHKLKTEKKELEAKLKTINKELTGYMDGDTYHVGIEDQLGELMVELEVQNFKVEGLGTVYRVEDVRPGVDDQEKLHKWLRKNGHGSLIKESVNWNTLRGFVNELRANFQAPPPGVSINSRTLARIRKK